MTVVFHFVEACMTDVFFLFLLNERYSIDMFFSSQFAIDKSCNTIEQILTQ